MTTRPISLLSALTPIQNERLDEENRVRLKEETRQARLREKRKEEAKNNIILQVKSDAEDLACGLTGKCQRKLHLSRSAQIVCNSERVT